MKKVNYPTDTTLQSQWGSSHGMFYNCVSLVNLDISNWNTSNVKHMRGMFSNCSSLTNLDLSNCNVSKIIDNSEFNTPSNPNIIEPNWIK